MKDEKRLELKRIFSFSLRDLFITISIIAVATGLCFFLRTADKGDNYQSMIFILAVFLISRFTNGYLFGMAASLISVLIINLLFTYPYYHFNFTLSGYPLTIFCTLAVAIATSALTTQIKQHSALLLETEKEKMRGNLLRAVSHDLRTPLTSILGSSSAIIENDDELTKEERLKLLREINEDAQWLIRIVENLLSITRIDGDRTAKITKVPEAAEELVAEAVVKFQKRFPEQPVTVSVPDELLMVPVDGILIEQVIINLLENAVLHGKGATLIQLDVLKQQDQALFSVSDNGCGIAEEVLPHIFDGYLTHQSPDESDTKRNMGIGLSVCNTIIKAHNGTMTAQNRPEGGALFRFTLPLEEM